MEQEVSAGVRPAKFEDIPSIRRLLRQAHAESRFGESVLLSPEVLTKALISGISTQQDRPGKGLVVVAEDDHGEICAIFAGAVSALYECLDALMATSIIWYARPGCSPRLSMGVFDYFVRWVEGSEHPILHRYIISDAIQKNHHAIGALLVRKRGFRLAGGLYEKGI